MDYYKCSKCGYTIIEYELDELEAKNYQCPKCSMDSWIRVNAEGKPLN